MDSADKLAFRNSIIMFAYLTIWYMLYEPIWQTIPLVKDLFPLPLPNGNLSYSDFIFSFGLIGFFVMLYFYLKMSFPKVNKGGFHRG